MNAATTISSVEMIQQSVCNSACSTLRLGEQGTPETQEMRSHCENLCNIVGPASSRLCLSYCISFPNDPVCPPANKISQILAATTGPTPGPTYADYVPSNRPLLSNYSMKPVASVSHLAFGYNGLLGLTAHEQIGIYTRNPSKYPSLISKLLDFPSLK